MVPGLASPIRGCRFLEGVQPAFFDGSEILRPAALPLELLRVQLLQPRVRVDVIRPLVVPDADDPREAQRESARVVRAPLDLVVGDLDDDLRPDMEPPALLRRR